ncbi:MAG: hypothetical protein GY719_11860 [bacterium]|nr:hypothetical protein [bacterium]
MGRRRRRLAAARRAAGLGGGLTLELDLEAAAATVRGLLAEQGELALRRWPSAAPIEHKDRRDFATAVDLEIETNLKAGLRASFPSHALSGEETGDEGDSDYRWLIDPIDGTKYYAGGSSLFALSAGLLHRGEPILGVVHAAASRQSFYAWDGGGAFVDGRKLEGPAARRLDEAIVNVDTPNTHALSTEERSWFESRLLELTRRTYRVRALGQASLAACWLAGGAFDAYVDLTGYATPQDVAAARVIMKEAGCRVEHVDPGVGPPRLLAAPPEVWTELNRILLD